MEEAEDEKESCPGKCRAGLGALFISFVIMPDSKLRYIKFVNCVLVCVTSAIITYTVSSCLVKI